MLIERKEKQMKATNGEFNIILTTNTNVVTAAVGDVVFSCKRYGDRQRAFDMFRAVVDVVNTYGNLGTLYVKEHIKKLMF